MTHSHLPSMTSLAHLCAPTNSHNNASHPSFPTHQATASAVLAVATERAGSKSGSLGEGSWQGGLRRCPSRWERLCIAGGLSLRSLYQTSSIRVALGPVMLNFPHASSHALTFRGTSMGRSSMIQINEGSPQSPGPQSPGSTFARRRVEGSGRSALWS
jgi:hypothetical protein